MTRGHEMFEQMVDVEGAAHAATDRQIRFV
jgi:hypothetical protein